MAENFYTILTLLGQAEIAEAIAKNTSVNLTQIAVGDGNGNYYDPSAGQTALVNERYRASVNSLTQDATNQNWLIAELIIPATVGGWYVREIGVFSSTGNLFAVGKVPATYKPQFVEGAGKDLIIRVIMEVSNASAVTLQVDPSVVLASKKYVDDSVSNHEAKADPHTQYAFHTDVDNAISTHEAKADPHTQYAFHTDVDNAISTHEAKADPHTQYAFHTDVDNAISTHEAKADPHTQYAFHTDVSEATNVTQHFARRLSYFLGRR
jgi:phage-related tail fiber protein